MARASIFLATIAAGFACAGPAQAAPSWERLWGKDVIISGTFENAEICTDAPDCQFGNFGNLGGEFQAAAAVAADPAGNVYVADSGIHRISKFDSAGNFVLAFGNDVDPSALGQFGTCTDGPTCRPGTTGVTGGRMNTPMGVAADGDGFVYVADFGNKRIQKFNATSAPVQFVAAWGKGVAGGAGYEVCDTGCGAGATSTGPGGEFSGPSSVAVNETGDAVYVGDELTNRVQIFDQDGNFQVAFGRQVNISGPPERCVTAGLCQNGMSGFLGGEFSTPTGVAADAAEVYVADRDNNRVQRFDPGGNFISAWGSDVDTSGDPTPNLCTVDTQCTDSGIGPSGGEFNNPRAVAVDGHGNAYVADTNANRIQKLDSSGAFQVMWGKGVNGGTGFETCTAAASCVIGQLGDLGGEMKNPNGVASDLSGRVFVSEGTNNRVQKFLDGATAAPVLEAISPPSPANENAPRIRGSAHAGATVQIYSNALCTGTVAGTGTADELASPGITVAAADNSTTQFAATATVGTTTSPCSGSLTYVEDSTGPDTVIDTAPSGTIATASPAFGFHATEPGATFQCRFDGQPFAACLGPAGTHTPLFPLTDGAHTFEVRALDALGNPDATPAQASFTVDTAASKQQELPPPVQGQLVNAIPEAGTVLVKLPTGAAKAHAAATGFVPLETVGRQLPVGTTLDTKKGTVLLTAATNATGGTQDGHFSKGLFKFGQTKKNPLTTLSMTGGNFNSCSKLPRGGSKKVLAARKRRRTLFSNVKGRFRTRGRNSTATVRGTSWTMTDTCSGTKTSVKTGSVKVRDFTLRKTKIVKAGHSYLARAPRVKKKRG